MQERFVVRTNIISSTTHTDRRIAIKTIVITGRPQAVMAVEKIGKLSNGSHGNVRDFLDGRSLPHDIFFVYAETGQNEAMIMQISE